MAYDLYPAVDENLNFAQSVRIALAKSAELRNQIVPMTAPDRNALLAGDLWDGRVIVNLTTNTVERYDMDAGEWIPLTDVEYIDNNVPKIYHGTADPPTEGNFKDGDLYCQYL